MLVTSLGDIIVAIDGKNMDVTWREMVADEKLCPDISCRYCLKVFFEPDGKGIQYPAGSRIMFLQKTMALSQGKGWN